MNATCGTLESRRELKGVYHSGPNGAGAAGLGVGLSSDEAWRVVPYDGDLVGVGWAGY